MMSATARKLIPAKLVALVFAVALIGERVSLKEIVGGMLIILSIVGFEKLEAISFSDLRRRKLSKSSASI